MVINILDIWKVVGPFRGEALWEEVRSLGGGALEVPIEIYVSSVFLSQLSQSKAGSSILHFLMVHCVTTDPKP